jgi:hypothetical protein
MRTHRATTRDLLRWTLSGFVGLTVAVAALAPTAAAKGAAR